MTGSGSVALNPASGSYPVDSVVTLTATEDSGWEFIGWYADQAHQKLGIPKGDPYKVYLAYHEGIGGYKSGTYLKKQWLIDVAHKVDSNAWKYHNQLMACQAKLPKRPWWHFWSYV